MEGRSVSQLTPADCPAMILAGGRSSRFGSDKALVDMGGIPLLLHLQQTLAHQGHAVHVIADRTDRYSQLGLDCLVDVVDEAGPLAGLASALRHRQSCGAGWSLILSCDLITWRPEWFRWLADEVAAMELPNRCAAVHFRKRTQVNQPRPEPLPCLLHSCVLDEVLDRLERRELALHQLLSGLAPRAVSATIVPQAWSFNTPEELRQLKIELSQLPV